MKLFQKVVAVALAGVMALSLLTGCAVGDAMKENAMLTAVQTVADLVYMKKNVKVSESKELSKKASGVFSAFKAAGWSEKMYGSDLMYYNEKVTYKNVDYIVTVMEMPKDAKDSAKWGRLAWAIFSTLNNGIEWDADHESGKLKLGFDVMNNAKLTDDQEKAEDYMVVFAKCLKGEDT